MGWKFLIIGEGQKKSELKDIIGEEEYNKLLGEIQESLKEPAPSYSIEYKEKSFGQLNTEFISDPVKECLFPRQNGKSSLLKIEIIKEYGYGDHNEYNPNYKMTGYRNPTWLGLVTEKCKIHGIVEKARYVIYFFTEMDMIPHLEKNVDTLKEEEHKLNKFNGQEFIDEVDIIMKTVQDYLMYKDLYDKEVKNED